MLTRGALAAPQGHGTHTAASHGSYTFITGAAGEARDIPGAGLLVIAVSAQFALSLVLRHELAREPFRLNEVRFDTRIERKPRPGVIPSRQIGALVLEVLRGDTRGALYRYGGGRHLVIDPEGSFCPILFHGLRRRKGNLGA